MRPAVKQIRRVLAALPADYGIWVRQWRDDGDIDVGFNTAKVKRGYTADDVAASRDRAEARRDEIIAVLRAQGISCTRVGKPGTTGEFCVSIY